MTRIFMVLSMLVLSGLPVVAGPEERPAAAGDQPILSNVVATVNGETILLTDLERRLGVIHGEVMEDQRAGFDLDRLLFKMSNDILLAQEARALEMDQEPPTNDQIRVYRENLLLRLLDTEEVVEPSRPTEAEIAGRYEQMYRRVTLRVVTRLQENEAGEVLRLLETGADIDQVAREKSVDPYGPRGGMVDAIARIDLQRDIAEIAFTLEPGQLAGPIRTDLGWSVIRIEAFKAADPELSEGRRREVSQLVQYEKASALRTKLAEAARVNHPVRIDAGAVAAVKPKRLPDARLMPDYPDPHAVVVRIGENRVVTAEDYGKALLTRWSGVRNEEAAVAAAPIILQKTIEKELLLAEAEQRGFTDRPEFIRAVHNRETELLAPRYLDQFVAPQVQITEAELKAYYDEHREEFHKLPRIRLGQITVATEKQALELAAQLRDGADLAWLAKQHSIDRLKETGGDRGWATPSPGVDAVNDQLLEAEKGTVLEPLGAPGNWQVLMVTGREEQGIYPYEEISGNIRQMVWGQKFKIALDAFMAKLRERAEIEINKDVLARLNITGTVEAAAEEEGDHGDHGH